MENSAQLRVAKQVQDLAQSYLPVGVTDVHIQRYVQYCMRILSSRIQPLSENSDKDHVKTMLIKKSKSDPRIYHFCSPREAQAKERNNPAGAVALRRIIQQVSKD